MRIIKFYKVQEQFGCFSNFAPYPIEVDGVVWPTSEHYFQAQKFAGTKFEEEIRRVKSPMIAARMGRDRSKPLRADWELIKDEIMRRAVLAKFTQHDDLRDPAPDRRRNARRAHTERLLLGRRWRRPWQKHARPNPDERQGRASTKLRTAGEALKTSPSAGVNHEQK